MIRSMTGFGQAQRPIAGTQYSVEIRSLNSRYFKATIRLPELWSSVESDIDKLLREKLRRGTVYFVLRMKSDSADAAYQVNTAALDSYLAQLEVVRPEQSDLKVTLDLSSLLLLPGVCTPPEPADIIEKAQPGLIVLINEAIAALMAMRENEGKNIAKDFVDNCILMKKQLDGIAKRAPLVVLDYHAKLKKRVEELLAASGSAVKEADLAREVAIYAERCDIAEEVSRLNGHISQFLVVSEKEDQPGRKMDFIAQEMLREANTIASKSNDVDIARSVVEIKTAIDRIKEQVQNVE